VRAQGGEVVATRDFGRRRLAYEIDGHLEGYYKVLYFTGFGDCVDEVKHEMRLLPEVVRGMVVVANPRFIHDPERQQQASEVAAEEEAEAEEFAEALPEAAEEEADVAVAEEVTPAEASPAETEVSAEGPVEEES
jgi:ribosomal protein S6